MINHHDNVSTRRSAWGVESHADTDDWRSRGLCRQVDVGELFFPEKGASTREAKAICAVCEVRDACLEYALTNNERWGIWGGFSERERRRMRHGANCTCKGCLGAYRESA